MNASVAIADDETWSNLYNTAVNKVPFSAVSWRNSICTITDLSSDPLVMMMDNIPLAGINIYYRKRKGGKFCKHPILTPYNTVIFSERFAVADASMKDSLWQQLLLFIRKNYIYPYFLADTSVTDGSAFQQNSFHVRQAQTYLVNPVAAVPDSDIRRRARKCSEAGFYIINEVNVPVFHKLFHTTVVRQGIKNVISEDELQLLLTNCNDFTWGMTAYDSEHVPHASWIQMNAGTTAYNWNAASNADLLSKGGTPFIVMKLLEKLKEDRIQIWDLCGADNPSVARFKASIGGVLAPYFKVDFSQYSFLDKLRFRFLQL